MYCGGLIGILGVCSVKNCYALCNFNGKFVAGLVGMSNTSAADMIENCYWYGSATSTSNAYGLMVLSNAANKVTISGCYYPQGYNAFGSNITGSNNETLQSRLQLTDSRQLVNMLNNNRPTGGCEWAIVNDTVMFKP